MVDNRKKLYIKTYGCQMNVYDSSRMADVLAPLGYKETTSPDGADMVILNTCHIREKAAEKVYSELGRIRQLQQQKADQDGSKMTVAVAGCVAQAEGAEIMRRAPNVDMVFGPQSYHKLPEMVARAARGTGQILDTDFPLEDKFDALPAETRVQGLTAFLTVQEGCDKFCSFCVVPYTRGSEYSRNAAAIIDEAKRLVDLGARDITLLGQNVNAWFGEGLDGNQWSLARLIEELAKIDKLWRIRFTTSHPKDMQQDLVDAFRDIDKMMPYLHLPVQSGSDRILEAMNRRHKADDYIRLVDMLRKARPDLSLSGDFIVGFPGESRRDFDDTMNLVREVGYAQAYSFNYSARPGTPAAGLPDMLSKEEKNERLYELQALLTEQQTAFNTAQVGKTLPVLLEKPGRNDGQVIGRSPYMQAVYLEAPADMIGQMIDVKIIDTRPNSLAGKLTEPPQRNSSEAA